MQTRSPPCCLEIYSWRASQVARTGVCDWSFLWHPGGVSSMLAVVAERVRNKQKRKKKEKKRRRRRRRRGRRRSLSVSVLSSSAAAERWLLRRLSARRGWAEEGRVCRMELIDIPRANAPCDDDQHRQRLCTLMLWRIAHTYTPSSADADLATDVSCRPALESVLLRSDDC